MNIESIDPEIVSALIQTLGTIIASIIGVAGIFLIVKNREDIIKLSKEVEAYHKHEGNLVKKILELENKEITPSMIQKHRGTLRNELINQTEDKRPRMTSQQAINLRKKYLSF